MRPYKGKRIDNGEWVTGCYIFCAEENEHRIITSILSSDDDILISACAYPVDPDTVSQYIGKDDAEGNPVFEKDTIKDLGNNLAKVVWNNDTCGYYADFGMDIELQELSFPFWVLKNKEK